MSPNDLLNVSNALNSLRASGSLDLQGTSADSNIGIIVRFGFQNRTSSATARVPENIKQIIKTITINKAITLIKIMKKTVTYSK